MYEVSLLNSTIEATKLKPKLEESFDDYNNIQVTNCLNLIKFNI